MFRNILVPVDLTNTDLAKTAIETAVALARASRGTVRLLNVLPVTPPALANHVPPDFDAQQRQSALEALTIIAQESGLSATQLTVGVRQGTVYHEVLEDAKATDTDLIVMSSHAPAMHSYFLGSNAGQVVRFARCSVLVVRR